MSAPSHTSHQPTHTVIELSHSPPGWISHTSQKKLNIHLFGERDAVCEQSGLSVGMQEGGSAEPFLHVSAGGTWQCLSPPGISLLTPQQGHEAHP